MKRIQIAFSDKEGCKLSGFIYINKVPGNFHISSHPYREIMKNILHKAGLKT